MTALELPQELSHIVSARSDVHHRAELFEIEIVEARAHDNGWIEYGSKTGRSVRVVRDLDREEVWRSFADLVEEVSSPR